MAQSDAGRLSRVPPVVSGMAANNGRLTSEGQGEDPYSYSPSLNCPPLPDIVKQNLLALVEF